MKPVQYILALALALILTGGVVLVQEQFARSTLSAADQAEVSAITNRTIIDMATYNQTVLYSYLGEKVPEKITEDEVVAMRTPTSYTRQVAVVVDAAGAEHPTLQTIVYTQPTFAQNTDGDWHVIEHATTTQEAWDRRSVPFAQRLEELIVHTAYADTATAYSAAGDGYLLAQATTFSTARTATTGGGSYTAAFTFAGVSFDQEVNPDPPPVNLNTHSVTRAFVPFDTSAICSGASISAATMNLYVTSTSDGDNDAQAYITVSTSTQATHTSLTGTDFDNLSILTLTAGNEAVATGDRKDITSISTSAYLSFTLDADGLAAIKKSGVASTCSATNGITCFVVREGHDTEGSQVATNTSDSMNFSTSEETGTSQDPYLSVTYTGCAAAATNAFWQFQDF